MRRKAIKAVPRSWSGDLAPTATGATDSVSEKMYAFAFRRHLQQFDFCTDVDSDDDVFDSPQSPSRTQPGQQPDTTTAETKAEADAAWLLQVTSDSSGPGRCVWLLLGPLSIVVSIEFVILAPLGPLLFFFHRSLCVPSGFSWPGRVRRSRGKRGGARRRRRQGEPVGECFTFLKQVRKMRHSKVASRPPLEAGRFYY